MSTSPPPFHRSDSWSYHSRTDSPTPLGSITKHAAMTLHHTRCVHTLSQKENSILSLAASDRYLFSGSQDLHIYVWDIVTFTLRGLLKGHQGSVLGLTLSPDQRLLFSSSGDGTVRVWDTDTLQCHYIVHPCSDVGDVFAVVYSAERDTMYIGCQNTSIQWHSLSNAHPPTPTSRLPPVSPRHAPSVFFDDRPGDVSPPLEDETDQEIEHAADARAQTRYIANMDVHMSAHDGYVYTLLLAKNLPDEEGEVLISGSGDGDVKLWTITDTSIQPLRTLRGNPDKGILTLALLDDGYLFCGVQGGDIKIWDLETFQMIRLLVAHTDDVLALSIKNHEIFSGSADGTIKRWSRSFECIDVWQEHEGIVLSMTTSQNYLMTGASDRLIKFWDVPTASAQPSWREAVDHSHTTDELLYTLQKWITMRTISGQPKYLDECLRGAKFLKNVLRQLGAESTLIPGAPGRNPLVFGKFPANTSARHDDDSAVAAIKVLVYGHYDVISVNSDDWQTNPFELVGKDGYLYGRGATDNKGPMLATIFAVHELLEEGALEVDVYFLIEGEEESGSVGFMEAVEQHKDMFGDIDVILLSNSYWLGEDVPCLTYGLRGVIHASIEISSSQADLHSGMEGGAVSEPLKDMIKILSNLVGDDDRVMIPGFYIKLRPVTLAEEKFYDPIVKWLESQKTLTTGARYCRDQDQKQSLMARWRYPTLTVHKIDVSHNNPTIIPRRAQAAVSMRVVPDQEISDICARFSEYVHDVFGRLKTDNRIEVNIRNTADWWLGDTETEYFKAAEKAIEMEWGVKPLYIREGGSIPAVRCLERFFNAVAVHLPMGQASDQAHLHNERIRLRNLHAGRRIVKSLLRELSAQGGRREGEGGVSGVE